MEEETALESRFFQLLFSPIKLCYSSGFNIRNLFLFRASCLANELRIFAVDELSYDLKEDLDAFRFRDFSVSSIFIS